MLAEDLDTIRVISRRDAITATSLSEDTWERMERRGETPPVTRLSQGRIGYRVIDIKKWLDARRIGQSAATLAILCLATIALFT